MSHIVIWLLRRLRECWRWALRRVGKCCKHSCLVENPGADGVNRWGVKWVVVNIPWWLQTNNGKDHQPIIENPCFTILPCFTHHIQQWFSISCGLMMGLFMVKPSTNRDEIEWGSQSRIQSTNRLRKRISFPINYRDVSGNGFECHIM